MDLTITDIIALAGDLSVVGTLAVVAYLFLTGKIMPRAVHDEMVKQNQELTKAYLRELADTMTIKVVEAVTKIIDNGRHFTDKS
jgi:hypothetical protein